jgi:hypothetical protein
MHTWKRAGPPIASSAKGSRWSLRTGILLFRFRTCSKRTLFLGYGFGIRMPVQSPVHGRKGYAYGFCSLIRCSPLCDEFQGVVYG